MGLPNLCPDCARELLDFLGAAPGDHALHTSQIADAAKEVLLIPGSPAVESEESEAVVEGADLLGGES